MKEGKAEIFMNFKKNVCAVLTGAAMLCAACSAYAWSVYDTEYGMEYNEQSKTAVTENMEQMREKDDPNDITSLIYTIREDGSAMITDYAGKFMDGEYEFNIPSEINGHPVTAIGDGALRDVTA